MEKIAKIIFIGKKTRAGTGIKPPHCSRCWRSIPWRHVVNRHILPGNFFQAEAICKFCQSWTGMQWQLTPRNKNRFLRELLSR